MKRINYIRSFAFATAMVFALSAGSYAVASGTTGTDSRARLASLQNAKTDQQSYLVSQNFRASKEKNKLKLLKKDVEGLSLGRTFDLKARCDGYHTKLSAYKYSFWAENFKKPVHITFSMYNSLNTNAQVINEVKVSSESAVTCTATKNGKPISRLNFLSANSDKPVTKSAVVNIECKGNIPADQTDLPITVVAKSVSGKEYIQDHVFPIKNDTKSRYGVETAENSKVVDPKTFNHWYTTSTISEYLKEKDRSFFLTDKDGNPIGEKVGTKCPSIDPDPDPDPDEGMCPKILRMILLAQNLQRVKMVPVKMVAV